MTTSGERAKALRAMGWTMRMTIAVSRYRHQRPERWLRAMTYLHARTKRWP